MYICQSDGVCIEPEDGNSCTALLIVTPCSSLEPGPCTSPATTSADDQIDRHKVWMKSMQGLMGTTCFDSVFSCIRNQNRSGHLAAQSEAMCSARRHFIRSSHTTSTLTTTQYTRLATRMMCSIEAKPLALGCIVCHWYYYYHYTYYYASFPSWPAHDNRPGGIPWTSNLVLVLLQPNQPPTTPSCRNHGQKDSNNHANNASLPRQALGFGIPHDDDADAESGSKNQQHRQQDVVFPAAVTDVTAKDWEKAKHFNAE